MYSTLNADDADFGRPLVTGCAHDLGLRFGQTFQIRLIQCSPKLMTDTSLSLLTRLQDVEDSVSWGRFNELYTPLMHRWLGQYGISATDRDDIVQNVMSAVAQEIETFQHNQRAGAFRTWLRRMLVFRVQNFWRNSKRQPVAATSDLQEQLNQLADENSEQSHIWNQEHDRAVVGRLMEIVRPRFQDHTWQAFAQQMLEGRNPAQVAQNLGITPGAVYMARNRILAALRAEAEGLVDTL